MKISRNWLQNYFKEPLPSAEKLSDLFNLHAFEVEGVEKVENNGKADEVLDIKVLPDRAHYALCHKGIAGEIQAITGLTVTAPEYNQVEIDRNIKTPDVSVKEIGLCNRYIISRIGNIAVQESPAWLKGLLEVTGQRSINTIVDATNFIMFNIGQPLHAFDADKVKGEIVVRMATEGEKITLLDDREVVLTTDNLVIADSEGPLAIAGVKGGKRAQVITETKNIILESAHFNPTSVRRTSTKYNLRNESSKRFENEITPELALEGMERVRSLIMKLSPGAHASEIVDIYPKPATKWTIPISVDQINAIVGASISKKEIEEILTRMNCEIAFSDDKKEIIVTPPFNRLDLRIPEDIADEVGRIYGYDKVVSVLPPDITGNISVDKVFYYSEKIKNILVSLGFSETLLYSLVPKGAFEIAYPLASDKAALRESLIPKMSDALVMNARNADLLELTEVKILEIGKVFPRSGEATHLSFGVILPRKNKTISPEALVKEAVGAIEKELQVTITEKSQVIELGCVIEINLDKLVAHLPQPKSISDLHFVPLPKEKKYIPFSAYPFSSRDVSIFVPAGVSENKPLEVIKKAGGDLLIKVRLLDVFQKEDKTSYAFRLIFQSYEKTLSEPEIVGAMQSVTDALVEKGWVIR